MLFDLISDAREKMTQGEETRRDYDRLVKDMVLSGNTIAKRSITSDASDDDIADS